MTGAGLGWRSGQEREGKGKKRGREEDKEKEGQEWPEDLCCSVADREGSRRAAARSRYVVFGCTKVDVATAAWSAVCRSGCRLSSVVKLTVVQMGGKDA